ncbi:hypothetical protein GCM10023184_29660 [Flaviaesturariibacter amylovorans]|uniref:Sulfatase-modifying factor enzyme domain-containing protein n=1 Tax=Flaviaesturariibacter amylovorans TaxID=1084520 RepID=A0ABP8H787_9BACT
MAALFQAHGKESRDTICYEPGWCPSYRITARSGSSPESSLMHVGFRCVKDID